jgi:hypothetical protein
MSSTEMGERVQSGTGTSDHGTGGNGTGALCGGSGAGQGRARSARRNPIQHRVEAHGGVRTFGLVIAIGMGLLGGFLLWRGATMVPYVLFGIGGCTLLLSLFAPGAARVVQRGWMALAMVLGIINTTILLTLFHLIFFGSLSLVWWIIGRDALKMKLDRNAATYWEKKTYRKDPQSYFSQF